MSRKGYGRAFRRAVAIEYLQSGLKRQDIAMKYGLPSVQTVSNWVNCYLTPYEIETKCVSLHPIDAKEVESMEEKAVSSPPAVPPSEVADLSSTVDILKKEVERLEARLRREEDKNLALNTMIDIAEAQGIRIRKKRGVKQ